MNRFKRKLGVCVTLLLLCLFTPMQAQAKDGSIIPAGGYDTTLAANPLMDAGWLQKQVVLTLNDKKFYIPISELGDMPLHLTNEGGVAAGSFTDTALIHAKVLALNEQLLLVPTDGTETLYDRASDTYITAQTGMVCQIRREFTDQLAAVLAAQLLGDLDPDDITIDLNAGFLVGFPAGKAEIIAGTCTTSLSGSSSNRINNVTVAAGYLNGTVIQPGETISISDTLKPRTSANGYKEAGVYMNGETVQALGGGICQVSSTTYNAAITSGLTILERHPHSMPVHYLPLGLDAAISAGSKDLQIRNDYDLPVTIQAGVSGKYLTVSIVLNESLLGGKTYKLSSSVPRHNVANTYLTTYDASGAEINRDFIGTSHYSDPKPKEAAGAEDE